VHNVCHIPHRNPLNSLITSFCDLKWVSIQGYPNNGATIGHTNGVRFLSEAFTDTTL